MPKENNELRDIKQQYESLVGSRGNSNNHWHEAAMFGSPRDRIFIEWTTPGTKMRQSQYDERAELTRDRASSIFISQTTPKHQRYFGLSNLSDPWDNKIDQEVLDVTEDALFEARYRPKGGFSEAREKYVKSLLGFGNGVVFVDKGPDRYTPIKYRFCHLANTHFIVDGLDDIIGVFESRKLGPKQIIIEFGEKNVPKQIIDEAAQEETRPNQETGKTYNVVHCVKLNDNYDPSKLHNEAMLYSSRYFISDIKEGSEFLSMGGYKTMPYAITRDEHLPYEIYGRGTFQKILGTIMMRNQMKKAHIAAQHNVATPTLLLKDDTSINVNQLRANRAVIGGLDSLGNPNVAALNKGINIDVSELMLKDTESIIREAFNMDLFIDNVADTRDRVTATEILTRTQEQARAITPLAGRDEDQAQNTMVEREIDILIDWGIIEGFDQSSDSEFKIVFKSQLSFAQKSDEVIAANRVIEAMQVMAQFDPSIVNVVDAWEYMAIVAEGNGVPAKMIVTKEEFDAKNQEDKEAQQAQSLIENAGSIGTGINQGIQALGGSPDAGAI